MDKENSIIRKKSFLFSLEIIQCCKNLMNSKEFVMSKQLLKSGTAVGALVREAEYAESRADFIHKLAIALKEASETDYWIDLLNQSGYLKSAEFSKMKNEIEVLLKLLTSIIKTAKNNRK